MGTFGINMNEFEGKAPGGWIPPDPGRQEFEITAISEGVNSQGEHAGERYITARCTQTTGDEPGTRTTSVYMGLSDKPGRFGAPIEQTVGWLKAWGRMDILERGEDAEIEELIGTTFEADVSVKTDNTGNQKVTLKNVTSISHAATLKAPEPKAAAAPVMRRGR